MNVESDNAPACGAPWLGGPGKRWFADRLEDGGDRPAVIAATGEALSYRELAKAADAFAASLSGSRKLAPVEEPVEV